MLQCLGMCLDMLLQVYVKVSRYVFGYVVTGSTYLDIWICCYRSMLQCIGMCLDMLLQETHT